MKRGYLTTAFVIGSVLTFFGALRKILHAPDASGFLIAGTIVTILCVLYCFFEMLRSSHYTRGEKIMWGAGFVFMGWITALVYLIVSGSKRKRSFTAEQYRSI